MKYYNAEGEYGFIVPDVGGADIFVHLSYCGGLEALEVGDRVSFDEIPSKKHPGKFGAANVRLLSQCR